MTELERRIKELDEASRIRFSDYQQATKNQLPPNALRDDELIEAYDNAMADYHRYSSGFEENMAIVEVASKRLEQARKEIKERMKAQLYPPQDTAREMWLLNAASCVGRENIQGSQYEELRVLAVKLAKKADERKHIITWLRSPAASLTVVASGCSALIAPMVCEALASALEARDIEDAKQQGGG